MVAISIECADGRPLSALTDLIKARAKWMHETAEQSVTATLLDVLVSIRALTEVAKPNRKEIELKLTQLQPSFTGGRNKPRFCLRNGAARYQPRQNERVGQVPGVTKDNLKKCHVYRWNDIRGRSWLVVAPNEKSAKDWAYNKIRKRAERFKGLARTALSTLMMKAGSSTSQKMDNPRTSGKSSQLTNIQRRGNGDAFQITANDLLYYAKLALKGGDGAINLALMKAANKIASTITRKASKLLLFENIGVPFPEVKQRK